MAGEMAAVRSLLHRESRSHRAPEVVASARVQACMSHVHDAGDRGGNALDGLFEGERRNVKKGCKRGRPGGASVREKRPVGALADVSTGIFTVDGDDATALERGAHLVPRPATMGDLWPEVAEASMTAS